jgi:glutathione peroxidase
MTKFGMTKFGAKLSAAAAMLFLTSTLLGAGTVYDFTMNRIDGNPEPLTAYKGKVLLIVNVASRCGFTPQYKGLQSLYSKYKDEGFVILGFPANNFGGQEPGTDSEIKTFCSSKYSVTFPMFSKVSVQGSDTTPLYEYLTGKGSDPAYSGDIKWNFTKFLIGRDGKILARFEPNVTPESPEVVNAVGTALR